MKLRTIALAALLGTGLLMTTGCNEDDVTNAIADALKVTSINVANGTTKDVTFTIEGELDANDQVVSGQKSKMFTTEGQDTYRVTNSHSGNAEEFKKDTGHLYALCANGKVLTDTATGDARKIEVFNLSEKGLGDSTVAVEITLYGTTDKLLAAAKPSKGYVGACEKAALSFDKTFNLVDIKKIGFSINGADFNVSVPDYDKDVQEKLGKLNDVDFDIVVFDLNATDNKKKGTIVPLATPKQLVDTK